MLIANSSLAEAKNSFKYKYSCSLYYPINAKDYILNKIQVAISLYAQQNLKTIIIKNTPPNIFDDH